MKSKKIIIGNWKMNPNSEKEAEKIFSGIKNKLPILKNTQIVVCAPFVFLEELAEIKTTKIKLGAQNVFCEESGAYTGEISAKMLINVGARYVIVGHSERRANGESDEGINKKIKACLRNKLQVILCVGEKNRDVSHEYLHIVKKQIEECLKKINKKNISKITIAYEPVWAIGKNAIREATPAEFLEMKIFIKKIISDIFGVNTKLPKIIYGGSVDEKNVRPFFINGDADGFLVGRASLDIKKFSEIIKICETSNK